ncbi:hypothetical protein CORC01_13922 [Colletotrichum orchidophilum]|uniref:Uncharacterized protein n=1 Tax=Colletotrichum orchidophilum TaxID=1209926 RepID=A0A1G4AP27_9PEZI|nr:uncharacterized protein CORC01_13922 [Colletotrichum orchidophilum]OHE90782.1 hypothetical protein CORC01_13922 [Colletotrichum orchidophilum]
MDGLDSTAAASERDIRFMGNSKYGDRTEREPRLGNWVEIGRQAVKVVRSPVRKATVVAPDTRMYEVATGAQDREGLVAQA